MAEHLKRNALDFLAEAEIDIKNGKYNLAMFHLEQSLQLALKYTPPALPHQATTFRPPF
jgi:HEPN domain-containing protein